MIYCTEHVCHYVVAFLRKTQSSQNSSVNLVAITKCCLTITLSSRSACTKMSIYALMTMNRVRCLTSKKVGRNSLQYRVGWKNVTQLFLSKSLTMDFCKKKNSWKLLRVVEWWETWEFDRWWHWEVSRGHKSQMCLYRRVTRVLVSKHQVIFSRVTWRSLTDFTFSDKRAPTRNSRVKLTGLGFGRLSSQH